MTDQAKLAKVQKLLALAGSSPGSPEGSRALAAARALVDSMVLPPAGLPRGRGPFRVADPESYPDALLTCGLACAPFLIGALVFGACLAFVMWVL